MVSIQFTWDKVMLWELAGNYKKMKSSNLSFGGPAHGVLNVGKVILQRLELIRYSAIVCSRISRVVWTLRRRGYSPRQWRIGRRSCSCRICRRRPRTSPRSTSRCWSRARRHRRPPGWSGRYCGWGRRCSLPWCVSGKQGWGGRKPRGEGGRWEVRG